jgi:serine/threonine-protein kinase
MRAMPASKAEDRLGDLVLVARRHLGPFSQVFVARPAAGGAPCVVKRALPHVRGDARVHAEFEREARLLASLTDARFPRLLGRGEQNGLPHLVLEYRPGPTVRALATAARALPRDERWCAAVLALAHDVLGGLAALHRRRPPVVHRDVSPENLLVSPGGRATILDLGAAVEGRAGSDEPIGKRAYMSPEQRAGQPLDGRADLYGLGVVLWELLAGARPHDRFDEAGGLPSLASVAPNTDPWTARWVSGLAAPRRDDRPPSAAAARRRVGAWLARRGLGDPRLAVAEALARAFEPDERRDWDVPTR